MIEKIIKRYNPWQGAWIKLTVYLVRWNKKALQEKIDELDASPDVLPPFTNLYHKD